MESSQECLKWRSFEGGALVKVADSVIFTVDISVERCTCWLVDWGLTFHQQLRSYGDGTSVYSPIRRTRDARDRTCDPWFTRRVT